MANPLTRWDPLEDVGASCEDGVLEVAILLPEQAGMKAVRITPKASNGG